MTDTPDAGVVYVATKQARFVEEAVLSAASLKRAAPEIPAWLYTDQTDCALLGLNLFDRVVSIASCDDYEDASAGAKIDRLTVLLDPPFERCLQIDTDTRILDARIRDAFTFLDDVDIAMIECHPDSSISRGAYGRPLFNGGFVLFRRNAKTKQLFEAWRALSDKHFRLADTADMATVDEAAPYLAQVSDQEDRRTLLRRDQLALAQVFSPETNTFALTYAQLSEGWNFRGAGERRRLAEPVIVDHRNSYKLTTAQDLLAMAFHRFSQDDRAAAGLIYNDVATRHAPDIAKASASALAQGFSGHEAPAVRKVGDAILAAFPADADASATTPQWLATALRISALHLKANQPEHFARVAEAITDRLPTPADPLKKRKAP